MGAERGLSDHFPVYIDLPIHPTVFVEPCIKKGSERELDFFERVTKSLEALADASYDTAEELNEAVDEQSSLSSELGGKSRRQHDLA